MKSVSCSTYIFVFFEYSNSMWGLPARSVRRTRTRRQAPFDVQGGAPTMRMRDKVALVTGAGSGDRAGDGVEARRRGSAGGLRGLEPGRGGRDRDAHRGRGR